MKRPSLVFVSCLLLCALLAGCVPSQAAGPTTATTGPAPGGTSSGGPSAPAAIRRGGTLHVGLNADLTTMDPAMSSAQVDRQVYQSIYNSLLRLDKDLSIKPELADKYEFTDPTTLVLTLHEGIKFQDGTDFNAQAVKVNFDRMLDKATNSPRASEIATVKEVVAADDHTVKLMLKQPDAALLSQLTDRAGMMVSPAAIQKYGKDLARNPVGTGPFQFVEWVKDDHLTVKKSSGYWEKGADGQPLPYLDQIIYKPVTDATVRLTGLKTGTLDIIDQVAPKDAPGLRTQNALKFDELPGLGYQGLELNNRKAPFDKAAVRQAVDYAIDREAIAKNVLLDTVTPGAGPIPPGSWAYDASVAQFTHDPAKAKQLLQQAGLTLPVSFSCYVVNTPEQIRLAQAYKQQLAEGGLDMQIELLEFGTALSKYNNFEHTCFQIGWSGRADPDGNTYSFLHTGGGQNKDQYANSQVDQLLEQARSTYDQARRKTLYSQALKIAIDEGAIDYLYWPLDQKTWTPKLQGFVHTADGMIRLKAAWLSQ